MATRNQELGTQNSEPCCRVGSAHPTHSALFACGSAVVWVLASGLSGCGPAPINLYDNYPPVAETPPVFDDRDWATVLRENVRDGLVDYEHLRTHAEPLTRYLSLIARVGPQSAPGLFPSTQAKLAYAVNAYNACVLAAVLYEQVPQTVYPVGIPSLDHRYRFRVDGRGRTLYELRTAAREASGGDPRVEFALCGAALGCPPLADQPFRPDTLTRDFDRLAREALASQNMVKIDHQNQKLLIGLPIADQREAFIAYARKRRGGSATLLNALLQMADGMRREWLNTAVGYREGAIPFDRALNRWPRQSS